MTWNARAVMEHERMTLEDWNAELGQPLPTDRRNVYEGDLGMDQNTAERIATALEQIALELMQKPAGDEKPPTSFVQPAASFPGFAERAPKLVPETCPVHGTAWRTSDKGSGAPFCPRKMQDGSWCKQHPTVAPQYERVALP